MTIQKHLGISDFYSGLYAMRTDDLGQTWNGQVEIPELAWRTDDRGIITAVADVTPGYHPPTGRLIAVGAQVRYSPAGRQLEDVARAHATAYAVHDPATGAWSSWRLLDMPPDDDFNFSRNACSQWLVEKDGTLLLAFYHGPDAKAPHKVTVFRCTFDGERLACVERGNTLEKPEVRGLVEPSLARFQGRYFLTLRNDLRGYVCSSADGLHYDPVRPWTFDDGQELGSYNTQQHWVSHSDGLFLCYTRRGANNDHIPRHRAPIFMAQVDPKTLRVIRATEQAIIPERGLMLGNFGAAAVTRSESWVTDSEFISSTKGCVPNARGGNGSTFVARLIWDAPNLQFDEP
jgi:hypothetical protein